MADAPAAAAPERLPRWLAPAVLALTLLAYAPTLAGYMVGDDYYYFRYLYKPFGEIVRAKLFLHPEPHDPEADLQFYRPLVHLWLHMKVHLWRGWLPGLRIDQLLLHTAVALSVARAAWRWTGLPAVGAMAALLFVPGPGHLRWMATIFGSNGLWAALFSVWTLIWTYDAVATGRIAPLVATALAGAAGMLSYEQVAVVPVLAVLIAFATGAGSLRHCLRPTLVAALLTAAYFLLRLQLFGGVGGYRTVEGETWIATASLWRLVEQVTLAQWAIAGSVAWPLQPPLAHPPAALTAGALCVWAVLTVAALRKSHAARGGVAASVLWIAGTSVPFAGIITEPHAWSAYIYFASVGGAILAAIVIHALLPERWRAAATATVLVGYLAVTWACYRIWFDTWAEAKAFVAQLSAEVPPAETPAIVAVEHLPGPAAERHLLFNAPTDHEAYTGYLPDTVFLRGLPVEWPYPFPYSGDREWPPPAELRLHWLRWDAAARRLTRLPDVPDAPPGAPMSWDFTTPAALRAWKPEHQLAEVRGAQPPAYATEGEYALLGGPALPPALGTPIYAHMRMRVSVPGGGRGIAEWHFRTAAQPDPSPAHVIRFWIVQDGVEHDYRVPLVNNPNLVLHGPPTRIDLRPTTTRGAVVQVFSIAFVPRPVESPR